MLPRMRVLTPEEREAVRQAVNDMRIEGFSISEERALALAQKELAGHSPQRVVDASTLARSVRRKLRPAV